MRCGILYLVAIMDWASRKVLAWQTVEYDGGRVLRCGVGRAIDRHGKIGIFNTDQGSQFTSVAFTNTLSEAGIRMSMEGRGHRMDNVLK